MKLDKLDKRILREIQWDGTITNLELAERMLRGLSALGVIARGEGTGLRRCVRCTCVDHHCTAPGLDRLR